MPPLPSFLSRQKSPSTRPVRSTEPGRSFESGGEPFADATEGSAGRLAAPAGLAEGEPAGLPFGGGEFSDRFCSAIVDLCPYRHGFWGSTSDHRRRLLWMPTAAPFTVAEIWENVCNSMCSMPRPDNHSAVRYASACRTSVSRRNIGETLSIDARGTPHLSEMHSISFGFKNSNSQRPASWHADEPGWNG